jgi:hypothetical protein
VGDWGSSGAVVDNFYLERGMTDLELLELAAKAAGVNGTYFSTFAGDEAPLSDGEGPWNPLTDDGDALRLAVKLNLQIQLAYAFGYQSPSKVVVNNCEAVLAPDPYAATRRAIVRAAAEIGKGMK